MERRRPGFTLVELLMVILIIGALVAILVPTLAAAFRKAKEAQVTSEMSNLATALASFKNTYGDYPPSRVILCETGFNSLTAAFLGAVVGTTATSASELPLAANATDMTNQQLVNRSLLYLRKFWPRADFNNNIAKFNGGTLVPGSWHDFDGDGAVTANPIILTGSECLAFFLGRIPQHGPDGITGLSGFSKSPTLPFVISTVALNRTNPNYEFNNGRLIDMNGHGMPAYVDPINTTPGNRRTYAYFFSYGNNGYDPNDVNGNGGTASPIYELEEDGSTVVERGFLAGFPVYNAAGTQRPLLISPSPNPYTSGPSASGNVSWINPNSFQLLSSGQDGSWGLGGTYSANAGSAGKLPMLAAGSDPGNINADDTTGVRLRETDNLANFSNGRLD